MKKKARNSAKKENTFGSMGRILFYSVALIVACFAVVVVLFETEAGQEIVAKVRGRRTSSNPASVKPASSESKHSEGKTNKDSGKVKTEEQAKSDESSLPRGDSVLKDTSAKPSDNAHEASSSESRNDESRENNEVPQENAARESTTETNEESTRKFEDKPRVDETTSSTVSGDSNNEKEAWEIIDEKLDEDEQDKPVEEPGKPVEEHGKPVEENKPVKEPVFVENVESGSEKDVGQTKEGEKEEKEISEEEKTKKEKNGNVDESKQSKSEEDESVQKQQEENNDKKDVEQEVNGGKVEEEGIKVGDSLAELEKQRTIEQKEEEERYEPIPEPEGPPIDLSPVNARRGLRGDYGGKDCKDDHKHCAPWARVGECDKNPVWMHVNCKRSCNVCSCSDNDTKCAAWAQTGECKKNAEWMNKNCMKSCKQC